MSVPRNDIDVVYCDVCFFDQKSTIFQKSQNVVIMKSDLSLICQKVISISIWIVNERRGRNTKEYHLTVTQVVFRPVS